MTSTTEGDLKAARKHLKTLESIIGKTVLTDILELKILKGEKDIECPINISYMEDAIMQVSSNGKCGGYTVDKDDLSRLQKVLKESHWKSELYTNTIFFN